MPASRPIRRESGAASKSTPSSTGPRSLWRAALWTGSGTAVVGSLIAIAVVAIVWLPASGTSGSASSTIRAGLLTFLASLHAGITVDGVPAAFLPLGMTLLTAGLAWRAGGLLADATVDLDEHAPARLIKAGALQAASFAVVCTALAAGGSLGTTSVSPVAVFIAAWVLFALAAGAALLRNTDLADEARDRSPEWLAPVARIVAAVTLVQLAAGALLVAGSLAVHHGRVSALSAEVGGGWSGVPILLLGVLAAPNAVIAGSAYLSGAGFAVGGGTAVGLGSTTHGVVPAFPIFGALPTGHGATLPVWLLAVATPVVAGCAVAALARRAGGWSAVWFDAALGVAGVGLLGAVLAWEGGGAIGSGRLHAVGASPWQYGVSLVLGVGAVAAVVLGAGMGLEALRAHEPATDSVRTTLTGSTLRAMRTTPADVETRENEERNDTVEIDYREVENDESNAGDDDAQEDRPDTAPTVRLVKDPDGDGKLAG